MLASGSLHYPLGANSTPDIDLGYLQVARETLVELEIPHVFISTARGSPKRQELFEKTGTFQVCASPQLSLVSELCSIIHQARDGGRLWRKCFDVCGTSDLVLQVPFLEDPNTGVSLFESADIIRYLEETYAVDTEEKLW